MNWLQAAMAESALNAAAESVGDFSAYGVLLERSGNRSVDAAPQALYPCLGTEVAGDLGGERRAVAEIDGSPGVPGLGRWQ
jgi:hypothetical protein